MRIIGYIDHERLKITVFKMNHKISIKFEDGANEQTFKFRELEQLNGLQDVQYLITPLFIQKVERRFMAMRQEMGELLKQYIYQNEEEDVEII